MLLQLELMRKNQLPQLFEPNHVHCTSLAFPRAFSVNSFWPHLGISQWTLSHHFKPIKWNKKLKKNLIGRKLFDRKTYSKFLTWSGQYAWMPNWIDNWPEQNVHMHLLSSQFWHRKTCWQTQSVWDTCCNSYMIRMYWKMMLKVRERDAYSSFTYCMLRGDDPCSTRLCSFIHIAPFSLTNVEKSLNICNMTLVVSLALWISIWI